MRITEDTATVLEETDRLQTASLVTFKNQCNCEQKHKNRLIKFVE